MNDDLYNNWYSEYGLDLERNREYAKSVERRLDKINGYLLSLPKAERKAVEKSFELEQNRLRKLLILLGQDAMSCVMVLTEQRQEQFRKNRKQCQTIPC